MRRVPRRAARWARYRGVPVLRADACVGLLPHGVVEGRAQPVQVAVVRHEQQHATPAGGDRAGQVRHRGGLVPLEQARGDHGGRPRPVPGQDGRHEGPAALERLPHGGRNPVAGSDRLALRGLLHRQGHGVVRRGAGVLGQGRLLHLRDARGHGGPQHVRDDAGLPPGHGARRGEDLLRQGRHRGEHGGELRELGTRGRLVLPGHQPPGHGPAAEADGHAGAGPGPLVERDGDQVVELPVQVRHRGVEQDARHRPLGPAIRVLGQPGPVRGLRQGEQRVRDGPPPVRGRRRRAAAPPGPCAPT